MANKRMFSKELVCDKRFNELNSSTKYLFFMLCLYADDEGVVADPKGVVRFHLCSMKDLNKLYETHYLLQFPSGVAIIKHWFAHNYNQKSHIKKSTYQEELQSLIIDERGFYSTKNKDFCRKNAVNMPSNTAVKMPNSIDKYSIDKYSIDKNSIDKNIKKVRKKEDELTFNDIINNFIVDTKLNAEMKEWVKGRLARKEKLTNYAVELACKKVLKMPVEKQIPSVEESIINGWKSIYEIKDNKIKQTEKETNQQKNQRKLNAIGEALGKLGEVYGQHTDTKNIGKN